MKSLILTAAEIATLVMLSVAIQDIVTDNATSNTYEELKALQSDLDGILYNDNSPLSNAGIVRATRKEPTYF